MGIAYIGRPCPSKNKQKREDPAVYAKTQCFVGWGYKSVEECGYQLKAVFLVGFMMWACNLYLGGQSRRLIVKMLQNAKDVAQCDRVLVLYVRVRP